MSVPLMPFGKHRGKRLKSVPTDYLQWCLEECRNLTNELRTNIATELRKRGEWEPLVEEEFSTEALSELGNELAEKVKIIYKQLTLQCHPDRGGSPEAMKAINDFHRLVQSLLRKTFEKPQ